MVMLLIFISGIVFYCSFLPILDSITEVIQAKKAVRVSNLSVIVNENQIIIAKAQSEIESSVSAIGFDLNSPAFEFAEEDDDDGAYEAIGKSQAGRIGF